MNCCDQLDDAIEREAFYFGAKHRIDDGRIVNDINTEYFIRVAIGPRLRLLGCQLLPFLRPRSLRRPVAGRKEMIRGGRGLRRVEKLHSYSNEIIFSLARGTE